MSVWKVLCVVLCCLFFYLAGHSLFLTLALGFALLAFLTDVRLIHPPVS
jgi:hypothetical protein